MRSRRHAPTTRRLRGARERAAADARRRRLPRVDRRGGGAHPRARAGQSRSAPRGRRCRRSRRRHRPRRARGGQPHTWRSTVARNWAGRGAPDRRRRQRRHDDRTANETVAPALKAAAYVEHHLAIAADLGMRSSSRPRAPTPSTRCAADATTAVHDRFAAGVYEMMTQRRARAIAGAALWNWGGEAAARAGRVRGRQNPLIDPPHDAGAPPSTATTRRRCAVPRGGAPSSGARLLPRRGRRVRAAARAAAEAGSGDDAGSAARREPAGGDRAMAELGGADRCAVQLALAAAGDAGKGRSSQISYVLRRERRRRRRGGRLAVCARRGASCGASRAVPLRRANQAMTSAPGGGGRRPRALVRQLDRCRRSASPTSA